MLLISKSRTAFFFSFLSHGVNVGVYGQETGLSQVERPDAEVFTPNVVKTVRDETVNSSRYVHLSSESSPPCF